MLDWLKADRNCVVVRRGGEQRKASLLVRTIRNSIRLGVLASPRAKWRSRESRWARKRNGPAETTPEREMKRARRKRTWEDTGWLETERQEDSGVVNRGSPQLREVKGRRVTEPP